MSIDASIFKAYDVRGIYPTQLDGEAGTADRARVRRLPGREADRRRARRADLVARDRGRGFISGRAARAARWSTSAWSGTDMLYFYVASQRPGRRRRSSPPRTIPRSTTGSRWSAAGALAPVRRRGHQGDPRARWWPAASRTIRATWDRPPAPRPSARTTRATACPSSTPRACPGSKSCSTPATAWARSAPRPSCPRLPLELVKMYFELDGTFPNHPAGPAVEEANRREIMERVKRRRRDLGHRLGRRRRPLLLHRRHRRVRARRLRHRAARRAVLPKEPGATHRLRRARLARRAATASRPRAAGRSCTASATRSSSADARRERRVRRRGLRPLLLPRQLVRRQRHDPALLVLELLGLRGRQFSELLTPPARALPHLGRDQLDGGRRAARAMARIEERYTRRPDHEARRRLGRLSTTGTSTCGPRTPSRCCASTSRPTPPTTWPATATRSSPSSAADQENGNGDRKARRSPRALVFVPLCVFVVSVLARLSLTVVERSLSCRAD